MMTSDFCFIILLLNQAYASRRPAHAWFFKIDSVQMSVCVLYLPLTLLITSGVIWIPYDWLHKSYGFYVAAVVIIITKHGLSIDAHHKNQPNKWKLGLLYKPSIHFNITVV